MSRVLESLPPADALARLSVPQCLDLLAEQLDAAPRALIDECARRGDDMVKALGRLLDDKRFWRADVADGQWWLRLHAAMILGLMDSERAGGFLVKLMRRVARVEDTDLQDWLAGAWPALFANKPRAVIDAVRDLATDRAVDWYMRAAALDVVVAAARAEGEDALERRLDWLASMAADEREVWDARMSACHLLMSFPRARHRALLDRLAAAQTGPYRDFSPADVAQAVEAGLDEPEWERFADPWKFYTPEEREERRRRWEEDARDEEPPAGDAPGAETLAPDDPSAGELEQDELGGQPAVVHTWPKTGRNDPCPCGSGKKYKHCHLKEVSEFSPEMLVWRRIRRAIDGLQPRLVDTAVEHFGLPALEEAWDAFCHDAIDDALAEDSVHNPLFLSWFCHAWLPDPADTQVPPAARRVTAAQAFLHGHRKQLDPIAQRYLHACADAAYSYYEVLSCDPGRGFQLKDLLLRETRYVFEASASQAVQRADIVFACLVEVDGVWLMEASGCIALPAIEKTQVIAQRRIMSPTGRAITRETLRDFQDELRALFLETAERLLNPTLPAMQNTDGEPIELRALHFEVPSAREAFDALKDLAAEESENALLSGAVFDASGALSRVEFAWLRPGNAVHKHWQNTVLGHVRIDGTRLTAEVNSVARARRFTELVDERLGGRARKLPEVIQSVESMLERAAAAPGKHAPDVDDIDSRPEVQALLAEMTRKHYREWVDQSIPALGNRTPRQAMRSADGREAVEALVAQLERDAHKMQPPLDSSVTRELRETLGLPPAEEG